MITETELRLIAALAMIGDRSRPRHRTQDAGGDRHAERVVEKRPDQILADVAHRRAREALDYIAAVREGENVRVTGDLVKDIGERLRVTRESFEAGRAPRFYLLRDEAEYANALQMDAMARSRAEQAVVALKTTLGIDLSSPITLADRLEFAPVPVSIDEGIRQASEAHPDIKAAIKQREAAQAEVRAAYGNYFPQVAPRRCGSGRRAASDDAEAPRRPDEGHGGGDAEARASARAGEVAHDEQRITTGECPCSTSSSPRSRLPTWRGIWSRR